MAWSRCGLVLAVLMFAGCSSDGASKSDANTGGVGGASGSSGNGGSAGSAGSSGSSGNAGSSGNGGSAGNGGSSGSSGSGGTAGGGPGADCAPLPAPSGNVREVSPTDSQNLHDIVAGAASGDTILFNDGTYDLGGAWLEPSNDGVTLRGKSGDRSKVILEANYQTLEPIRVTANDITVADLTIQHAGDHAIHVAPEQGSDINGTLIYNVVVLDPGEQGIKINGPGAGGPYPDTGTIACSSIKLSAAGRPHVDNCYTGGIDGHVARGWNVRDNHIDGFWCNAGLSEHAVHFWTGSRDTVVERNVITNCARGVGFGLEENRAGRNYPDNPCGGVSDAGHYDGVIRNNFIFANDPGLFGSQAGFDSGIGLEQACGAVVAHNTVFATQSFFAGIDVRFAKSTPILANNLMSSGIKERNNGQALTNQGNIENASSSWFVDGSGGDLHLAASAGQAIDKAASVSGAAVSDDIDGDTRSGSADIGADERK